MARIPEYVHVTDTSAGRRYEVRVEVGGGDGARRQVRRRFRTLREATEYHTGITADRARGTHVAPNVLTVQGAVDAWLAGQRIRPKTLSAYVTSLRPVVDALGDRPVQTITKADIEAVVAALRAGKSKTGTWNAPEKLLANAKKVRDPWAPASINPMLARLRTIWADLVAQGIVARNVATLVKPIPTEKPAMRTLDAAQVAQLLAATTDDPLHIAWQLAVHGLRRGEILALAWGAVDLDAATLAVTEARLATAGGSSTGAPKTPSSIRTLPIPETLADALRREQQRQGRLQTLLGTRWPASGLVVVDDLGQPPYPDTLTHAWRRALAAAGLPHVRLHDARHSCATLMHLAGVPATVIAAWLGHTDARFTLATYTHAGGDALSDAAATLGGVLGGGGDDTAETE